MKHVFKQEATIISDVPFKDISGNTAKSKMELFLTKVNGFKPLAFITKSSNLDFAIVLHMSLLFFITRYKFTKKDHHNFRTDSDKDVQSKKKTFLNKSKENYK